MQERKQKRPSRGKVSKAPTKRGKAKQPVKTIVQLAAEARSLATREEWQQLPADLSKHFDDYHYGPKQDRD